MIGNSRALVRVVLALGALLLAAASANGQESPDTWVISPQIEGDGLTSPQVSVQATNARGDVFRLRLSQGGPGERTTGFLLQEDEGREILALGEPVHAPDGTALGTLFRVEAAVLFHNGTLLLETLLGPAGGSGAKTFLTYDGSGFAIADVPASRTIVSGLLSGRVTVSGRYLLADAQDTGPNLIRNHYIMNGLDVEGVFPLQRVDASVQREILDYNDDFVLLFQRQFVVLATNFFGEAIHIRENWQLDIRNLQETRIITQKFWEEVADFSFGFLNFRVRTVISATGEQMARAWLSDSSEVIAAIRSARVGESTIGFREPELQRRKPEGVVSLIYDMNETAPLAFGLPDVVGALPGGGVLVLAEESASGATGFFALRPGVRQPIIRSGDVIGGAVVSTFPRGIPESVRRTVRLAEGTVAFAYQVEGQGETERIAVALPPNVGLAAWNKSTGGDWEVGDNWSPARVPIPGEQILFDLPGNYPVNVGQQQTGSLRVERGIPRFVAPALQIDGEMRIGGPSSLVVSGGQTTATGLSLGHLSRKLEGGTVESTLTLRDAAQLDVAPGATVIGERGTGDVRVLPGSSLFAQDVILGRQATGTAEIAGLLTVGGSFVIGEGRPASLVVPRQGSLFSLGAVIGGGLPGVVAQGEGAVDVRGTWDTAGDLTVGADQEGSLFVSDSGTMNVIGDLKVGTRPGTQPNAPAEPTPQGTVFVSGADTQMEVSGDAQVGRDGGFGVLSAGGGAQLQIGEGLVVPFQGAGSRGFMLIEGGASSRTRLRVGPESTGDSAVPCLLGLFGSAGEVQVLSGAYWSCPVVTLGGTGSGRVVLDGRRGDDPSELNARSICVGGGGRNSSGSLLCGSANPSFGSLVVQNAAEVRTQLLEVGPFGRIVGDGVIFSVDVTIQGTVAPGVDVFDSDLPLTPIEPTSGSVGPQSTALAGAKVAVLASESTAPSDEPLPVLSTSRSVAFAPSTLTSNHDAPSPSTLTLVGAVTFGSDAVIELDIWGADPSLHDRLVVDGTLDLNGATLVLNFRGGYTPSEGDLLDLIAASGGVTGAFGTVLFNGVDAGLGNRIEIVDGRIILTVLGAAGPGGDNGGVPEGAAPPAPIPTLSQVSLLLLALLLLLSGSRVIPGSWHRKHGL